ncbi:MAG: hypothetical protein D4R88_09880 [Methanosarcinales archaeon]|nr:MAG: hypothetical protein D4R88_09880 [Methanosarcinales archaeon]
MNTSTGILLLFFAMAILSGVPKSFARPQYLNVFNEVYGGGSCSICHIMASGDGMRDHNGTFRPDVSNGTYEPRSFNRTNDTRSFNRTPGLRNSNRTMLRTSYGSLFEEQPDHASDPQAALIAIGEPPAGTPQDTTSTGAQAAPGFEIGASLFVLFGLAYLVKQINK